MKDNTGSMQEASQPVVEAGTCERYLQDVENPHVEFESLRESQCSTLPKDSNIIDWDGLGDTARPLNWPPVKKWTNIVLISILTLLTPFASSMLAPAIKQVMQEFGSTNDDLGSFAVSVYLLGYAFGPLFLAPCSELYGRLPVYHACTALFIFANVACAKAVNMPMLIVSRFITGVFGAGPLTVGPGSVADCFGQKERGRVMAIWTTPVLLGPALGPAAGAYISRSLGWRWNFWFLIIMTGAVFIPCIILLRETHPPTILQREVNKLRKWTGNTTIRSALESPHTRKQIFVLSIIRPTKMLFFSPIIFGLSLLTAIAYGTLYLLFTTVADQFITQYGIVTNVGLVYLSFGVGQLVGISIFGAVSDSIVRRMAKGGEMKPEYRLPPMLPGAALIPAGLLLYGWTLQYRVFWLVPLIGGFLIGMGMIVVFTSVGTYLVDAFPAYAASATAANTVFRSIGGGLLPLAGSRMYVALGQGWGNTLLAGISLAMMGMIWLAIRYGERLRTHPRYQLKL